ncbi:MULTISPECIES: DNA cytosine methyltransferase [Rhizobium]|uniref:DNA cytosine methyltransferase n=1 Tax=Rhizobium TaxID=379 RepID=UPI0013EE462D|nr:MULTISPECIES: DNA cytosine methyltransferase [Rhizobium]ULJ81779.1 DNA cytosine methyltransferase [Rhizobium sp. C104]
MAKKAAKQKISKAARLNRPLGREERLVRAQEHMARIRSAIRLQISTIVDEIDVLTREGRANVEVLMKDFGFTDAEYNTFSNITSLLAKLEKEVDEGDLHFDNYRALLAIDEESHGHAAQIIKKDPAVTHDEIMHISDQLAHRRLPQGERAFKKSREAFNDAFAVGNRAVESSFRRTATELFGMMSKHSRRSSYVKRTARRFEKLTGSRRYSFFFESQSALLADIIKTSGELLTMVRSLFPDSPAPVREWAGLANHSPIKAYLAQAHHSLQVMSNPDFNGRMPGDGSIHYEWSSFDAIRFLAELAPEYEFGLKEEIDPRDVRKLNAIDLCANAGGQALGIEAAGYYMHGLVDRDEDTIRTLQSNRRRWNAVKADIAAPLIPADLDAWRGTNKRAANLDLVSGSFPISPFAYHAERDGELFTSALRIIEKLNPKGFFFETDLAFNAHRNDVFRQDLITSFWNLGYETKKWTLSANEFGVPQDRTRMYFVGIKRGLGSLPPPTRSTVATVGPAIWTAAFPDLSPHGVYEVKKELKLLIRKADAVEKPQQQSEQQIAYDGWAKAWASRYGAELAPDMDKHRVQPRGMSAHLWRNAGFDPQRRDLPRLGDRLVMNYGKRLPLLPLSVPLLQRLQVMPDDWRFEGDEQSKLQQVCSVRPPVVSLAIAREIHRAITSQAVDLDHPAAWKITSGKERFIPGFAIGAGTNHPDPLSDRAQKYAEEQREREREQMLFEDSLYCNDDDEEEEEGDA